MDDLSDRPGRIFGQELPVAPLVTGLNLEAPYEGAVTLNATLVCGERSVLLGMTQDLTAPEGVGSASLDMRPVSFADVHVAIAEWFDLPAPPLEPLRTMLHRALRVAEVMSEASGERGLRDIELELRGHLDLYAGTGR